MAISVVEYGAAGDGSSNDQAALQKAIDTCSSGGGGTVVVPAGVYRTGTLRLRDGVELHLEAGATIRGVDTETAYPSLGEILSGDSPGHIRALLWAEGAGEVSVTGMGTIDGGGDEPIEDVEGCTLLPALVFLRDCTRVRITDVRLHHARYRTLHLLRCHDVTIRGVSIQTIPGRAGTDGIDPDGCGDVRISDCTIVCGGDAVCLKSTEGDPCERIMVTTCSLSAAGAAVKLGSESAGDIRNVLVGNCAIHHSTVAVGLYMKDGGTFENITVGNCTIQADGDFPVVLDVTPRYGADPTEGTIRDVTLHTLFIEGKGRIYLEGRPEHPIVNCTLRDITCQVTGDCTPAETHKPAGSRRVERDPKSPNYAVKPYHLLGMHLDDVILDNLTLEDRRSRRTTDRGVLYLKEVHGMIMSYRSTLARPSKKPEMLKEGCQNVRLVTHRGR
jgi:hypothetical protein